MTEFYCCDLMVSACKTYDNIVEPGYLRFMQHMDYKFCPFCGRKLSTL